jgi:hypothetical protein
MVVQSIGLRNDVTHGRNPLFQCHYWVDGTDHCASLLLVFVPLFCQRDLLLCFYFHGSMATHLAMHKLRVVISLNTHPVCLHAA